MSFAIIDAAAGGDQVRGLGCRGHSRYSTPIANLPLIYHVFDELAAAGIDRVRVIVGAAARGELERVLGGGSPWGVQVSYTTAEPDGRTAVLAELERVVEDEPVLVYPGDCLFPGQLSAMWARFSVGDVDAVVLGGGNGTGSHGRSRTAELSVRVTSAPAIIGRPGATIMDRLKSSRLDQRDLAAWLRAIDCRVAVCELGGHWRYSDETEELLVANRMMLDALPVPTVEGNFGDNNVVHGRVAISSSARISGCILHGPVAVDHEAIIEDSFVGPYTAIGARASLSGAELDNTMVLPDAEISHPGHRIEASIIGERAQVVRSFALPRGLHLRLEPHSRIILS